MNGKAEPDTVFEQRFQKLLTHFLAPPGCNSALKNRQSFVWYHQIGVDAEHFPKTVASAAGSVGVIKGKQIHARLLERDPVHLELIRKGT